MDGLFISYRREDTAPYAGRLYDFLRRALPDKRVFMDIDAIDPGEDFIDAIDKTLADSKIVLAIIGPNWSKITDSAGNRRLDNPDDYVVRELSAALRSSARVIPVLVGGSTMPRSDVLPESLQAICRRNAIEISDSRFHVDADRLASAIGRATASEAHSEAPMEQKQAENAESALAESMAVFRTLLWTNLALGVPSLIFSGRRFLEAAEAQGFEAKYMILGGYAIFGIAVLGANAWFNIKLLRGRNWARMASIALMAFSIPSALIDIEKRIAVEIGFSLVNFATDVWIIRLMFSDPIRRTFRKRQALPIRP